MESSVLRFAFALFLTFVLVCASASARFAGAVELRVLSYNIQALPFGVDDTRLRDIGRILKEARAAGSAPQVVLIQEAFSAAANEIPADWGYTHHQWGPPGFGFRVSSGLLIVSDFPIVERRYWVFQNCGGVDCLSRKGVLLVRVAVPGLRRRVDFVTTHLNSDYFDQYPDPAIGTIIRMRQVEEMSAFLARNRDPAAPVVFGGDFNFRVTASDFELFRRLTGLWNAAETCLVTPACRHGDALGQEWPQWIDHVFVQGAEGVRAEVLELKRSFREPVNGRRLSDHDAVEARLSFDPFE